MSSLTNVSVAFTHSNGKKGLYDYSAIVPEISQKQIPLVVGNQVIESNLVFICFHLGFVTSTKVDPTKAIPYDLKLVATLTKELVKRTLHPCEATPKFMVLGVELCKKKGLTICSDEMFNQIMLNLSFKTAKDDDPALRYLKGDRKTVVKQYAARTDVDLVVSNLAFKALIQVERERPKREAVAKKAISDLEEGDIPYLDSKQFPKLEDRQLPWVPVDKYHHLKKTQISKLSSEKIGQITDATFINSHLFPTSKIPHISDPMVPLLTNEEKIQHLLRRQIHLLPDKMVLKLRAPTIDLLTPEQVERCLDPKRVSELRNGALVAQLQDVQHVHHSMVDFLVRPVQIQQLTTFEQIHHLSNERLVHLKPEAAKLFSEEQWTYILTTPAKERFLPFMKEGFRQKFFPKPIETPKQPAKVEKNLWKAKWNELGDYTFLEKVFFIFFVLPYSWIFGSKR